MLANSTSLQVGDWRVDPAVDEISRDGLVVNLEPRSMHLLVYLAERAGQVVGVEDLLNEVWAGVIVTPDSVYQGIAALRRTLGDNSKNPKYIATLPRRGYRLVAKVTPWSEAAATLPSAPQPTSSPETVAMTAILPLARSPSLIRWNLILVSVGISLLIGYFVLEKTWHSRPLTPAAPLSAAPPTAISDKSIAVLPFTDMSEGKDQQYLGDGMAEEIVDLLIEIPGLVVIGRTSSFQFKGKSEDLRTIGTKLNAAYVLEGSVRKSGDRVRITAQLINTRTGTHEWSETYDRRIGDVLDLQDAIAAAVARELQLTVASRSVQSHATAKNTDAYDLILHGRHAADRFDREGLDEAVTFFKLALDRDATSAAAAAQLACAYETQGEESFLTPAAAFEQARRAASTALKLDPTNLLAHAVLGRIHVVYDWDWAAAEREFQQVATVAPGSVDALNCLLYTSEYNAAIAAHDPVRLRTFFVDDYHLIMGSSGDVDSGGDAATRGYAEEEFKDPTFVTYRRTPTSIVIAESGKRIAETGRFEGIWRKPDGTMRKTGVYLAMWIPHGGSWRLKSEAFVTLACTGSVT